MQMQGVHVAAPHDVGRSTNGSEEPLPIGEFYPPSVLAAKIEFMASPDTALPALASPWLSRVFSSPQQQQHRCPRDSRRCTWAAPRRE